jgi:hypothetical protein
VSAERNGNQVFYSFANRKVLRAIDTLRDVMTEQLTRAGAARTLRLGLTPGCFCDPLASVVGNGLPGESARRLAEILGGDSLAPAKIACSAVGLGPLTDRR